MDVWVNGAPGPRNVLVGEYLDRVASRDIAGARALVLSELSPGGAGLVGMIDQLLVPAMAEVGARWYDGRWTAAQEHIACGISETVLSAASVRTRIRRPPADAPTVVLACPRGEAHVLPARFAAELLAEAGADVIVLGLPLPDRDLASFLAETRPCALILSCTEPLALPGLRDAIAAAHHVGIPVLVGGAGLGSDASRARAVGADGWARRPDEALVLLRAWSVQPPSLATAATEDPEVAALERLGDSFVDDVMEALRQRIPAVAEYREREIEQVRSDLQLIVNSLSCALLGRDDRLFTEFVAWRRGLLDDREVHAVALDVSLAVVRDAMRPGFAGARRMLTAVLTTD